MKDLIKKRTEVNNIKTIENKIIEVKSWFFEDKIDNLWQS